MQACSQFIDTEQECAPVRGLQQYGSGYLTGRKWCGNTRSNYTCRQCWFVTPSYEVISHANLHPPQLQTKLQNTKPGKLHRTILVGVLKCIFLRQHRLATLPTSFTSLIGNWIYWILTIVTTRNYNALTNSRILLLTTVHAHYCVFTKRYLVTDLN
jgi:hypothetical protein